MKRSIKIITAAMATTLLFTGCSISAGKSPREDEEPDKAKAPFDYSEVSNTTVSDEEAFISEYNRYSFELLSRIASSEGNTNVMVSPASVMVAFDVVAAGANGDTLTQLTDLFANSADPLEQQAFAAALMDRINSAENIEFSCANAIWNNSNVLGSKINPDYVEYVFDTFGADAREEAFDNGTVDRINAWISDNTDGMIDNVLNDLPVNTAMVVANAIAFNAQWETPFSGSDEAEFTNANGETQWVNMLSDEMDFYYETDEAEGFIRYYEGSEYAFVAILPKDETVNANEFLASFTGEDFEEFMNSDTIGTVKIRLPEFESDYDVQLNDYLIAMGAEDAFDEDLADFSGISEESELYVDQALHNTHIKVTEEGTQAAASTVIVMRDVSCAVPAENIKVISCDRPFVYAIIETSTNMPIFVGTVNNLSE